MSTLGLLVLRLTLATVFVARGAHTLFGLLGGLDSGAGPGGLDATAARLALLPVPAPYALAVAIGLIQFLGGAMMGVGLFTRTAASAALAYVAFTIWADHRTWGFFLNWIRDANRGNGLEYAIVLAGALVCLILAGAGEASIDGTRDRSRAIRDAGRARLRHR